MALTQDEFFDDEYRQKFPQVADDVRSMVDQMYPEGGLSEDELRELNRLSAREERLAPLETPRGIGSTRQRGNPFSYDVSPVVNAAQDALVKGVNAMRQRRMLKGEEEFNETMAEAEQAEEAGNVGLAAHLRQQAEKVKPPKRRLEELRTKQEQGEQTQESRRQIMEELAPSLAKKMVDLESNLKQEDVEKENEIDLIRERTKQAIKEYNQTQGGEGAGGSGRNPKNAVGVVTGFIGQADPYIKSLTSTIEQLEKQKALVDNPGQLEQRIQNLKAERGELQRWTNDAYRALSEGNLYDDQLIERFEVIVNAGQQGKESNYSNDYSFVDEMMKWVEDKNIDYQPQQNPGTGTGGASGDTTKVKSRVNFDTDDEKKK